MRHRFIIQRPQRPFRATAVAELAQVSFWDALILATAKHAGAAQLYSEDLNSGWTIAGGDAISIGSLKRINWHA
jgi:predicted nucleic acid-binding protein